MIKRQFLAGTFILISFALILSGAAFAENAPQDKDMILSKQDARQMFEMTRNAWTANVRGIAQLGAAQVIGKEEEGLVMVTQTPLAILWVRPFYENPDRPMFIQVTVGYRQPIAALMSDDKLKTVIDKAKIELSPEFNVQGAVEHIKGGTAIFFTVTEVK